MVNGQQYTFELFVCMAILAAYRESFMGFKDVAELFMFTNRWVRAGYLR